jgi:hypothetical protein
MGTRNRNQDRANLGEQMDSSESEMDRTNVERTDRTNVERSDRSMSANSLGDGMAGSEGIEDPVTETGRQHGREHTDDASSFSGQGAQKEGSVTEGEGTGYTGSSRGTSGGRTRNSSTRSRNQKNQSGRQQTDDRNTENTESEDNLV